MLTLPYAMPVIHPQEENTHPNERKDATRIVDAEVATLAKSTPRNVDHLLRQQWGDKATELRRKAISHGRLCDALDVNNI